MVSFLSGWASGITLSTAAVQEHWLGNFILNLIGYGLIILPAALLIRRWKNSTLVKAGSAQCFSFMHMNIACVHAF